MVQRFDEPVLSAEQKALLQNMGDPLKAAKRTLEKLATAGFDVTDDMIHLEAVNAQREGLLSQFSRRTARRVSGGD